MVPIFIMVWLSVVQYIALFIKVLLDFQFNNLSQEAEMTNNYSHFNACKLIIILTIIPQIRGRSNINKTNF